MSAEEDPCCIGVCGVALGSFEVHKKDGEGGTTVVYGEGGFPVDFPSRITGAEEESTEEAVRLLWLALLSLWSVVACCVVYEASLGWG